FRRLRSARVLVRRRHEDARAERRRLKQQRSVTGQNLHRNASIPWFFGRSVLHKAKPPGATNTRTASNQANTLEVSKWLPIPYALFPTAASPSTVAACVSLIGRVGINTATPAPTFRSGRGRG